MQQDLALNMERLVRF